MEIWIANEMISAGIEAKREAEKICLTEADIVREIYIAMYLYGIKAACEGEETVH